MTSKLNLVRLGVPPNVTNWQGRIGSGLIVAAWLWANLPALQWLFESLRDTSRFNLVMIGVVAIALLLQGVQHRQELEVSSAPALRLEPLAVMFGAAFCASVWRWMLDVEQITVLLFALGTYGLAGLFIAPSVWRKGLPVAILVACTLPFSVQFSTGLGFPARVLTAYTVEQILAHWHIAAISSHDIIVLENGIAHVDLPCSGHKSLWTGTLFLLIATWLEGRQIKFRWLLVCAANILLLISANIGRVLLLVIFTHVLKQPELADLLHIPLGVLGFVSACLLTWVMLQTIPRHRSQLTTQQPIESSSHHPAPLSKQVLLFACILGLAFIPQPQLIQAERSAIATINWLPQMHSEPLPLTATEQEFFVNYPGAIAQKQRFEWGNISGSMLVVSSTTWKAHHSPELCFVGNGFKVDQMERRRLSPDVLGRWLSLENRTLSAAYWFQSPKHTTDEFLSRLWGEVIRQELSWVLVSVLFDKTENPETPQIRAFVSNIHDAIAQSLNRV